MKYINTGNKDTRSGFGDALTELGRIDKNVIGLCADLTTSLKMEKFKEENPNRFFQCGISEANMIGVASGMALSGKIPYVGTFANFATSRVYDQIRQSICYSNNNVKICGSHAGLTLGQDGATHQILEDIGMMKMLPNMTVIVPCDYNQTYLATMELNNHIGPAYLRFGRPKWPNFTNIKDENFKIGKIQKLIDGSDVSLFACGHLVWYALQAAEILAKENIKVEVINVHTIKPLNVEGILNSVKKTKCVVTAEEHQKNGGLGDSIAQVLCLNFPSPIEMIAVNDSFGESGEPEQLLNKYGLSIDDIIKSIYKVILRK